MVKIMLVEGKIRKKTLSEIFSAVKTKCFNSYKSLHLEYGYYITRIIQFYYKYIYSARKRSMLDIFNEDIYIFVPMNDLMLFIITSREYINIEFDQNHCLSCSKCYSDKYDVIDGMYICGDCGYIFENRMPGPKDITISSNKKSNHYSIKTNLIKTLRKFEGKTTVNICKEDLSKIISLCELQHINLSKLKCNTLMDILKQLNMSKYYEDAYAILYIINKNPPKHIAPYRQKIYMLHDILEHAYSTTKTPTRINSMNVHYKLYRLFKMCGLPFTQDDFCMLKTEQKLEEHEKQWRDICKITGWT